MSGKPSIPAESKLLHVCLAGGGGGGGWGRGQQGLWPCVLASQVGKHPKRQLGWDVASGTFQSRTVSLFTTVLQVFQVSVDKAKARRQQNKSILALHGHCLQKRGRKHIYCALVPLLHTFSCSWTQVCACMWGYMDLSLSQNCLFPGFHDSMAIKEAFEKRETLSVFPRNGFQADVVHYSCSSIWRGSSDIWITSLHQRVLAEQGKLFISH